LGVSIIDHAHDGLRVRQDGAAIIFLDDFLSWDCEMRVSEIKYALTWFFGSAHKLPMVHFTMDKGCPDRTAA
jgi:hypothetical protein